MTRRSHLSVISTRALEERGVERSPHQQRTVAEVMQSSWRGWNAPPKVLIWQQLHCENETSTNQLQQERTVGCTVKNRLIR